MITNLPVNVNMFKVVFSTPTVRTRVRELSMNTVCDEYDFL